VSNNKLPDGGGFIGLMIMFAIIFCIVFRGIFASPERAVTTLEKIGFSDVKIVNHGWVFPTLRGCGADAAIIEVKGTNPVGKRVNLNICLGWPFKGATIRGD
jgi:hypothetical protein